jgi:steroid 5-alpha reductase family enzyme
MTLLGQVAAVLIFMAIVMNLAWVVQRRVANTGWVDVFWTFGTGIAGVAIALWPSASTSPTQRQILVAALAGVWALRLGLYIARRVASSSEDARYALFRQSWGAGYQSRLLLFLQPQAPVTALLCLSIALAAHRPGPLGLTDMIGAAILVVAILGEGLADRQLARFKAAHTEKGAICDAGLWGWSRHPNYFFEWFGWLAYPVIAIDAARPVTLLSVAAPVVMFVILRFVTGVPPLERAMLASRGDRFRAYQARTAAFIPLPPRRAKGASA